MRDFWNFIKSMAVGIAMALIIMNFVLINAYVPTGSMENTIMAGDRLLGVRFLHDYKRGDIIIFKDPDGSGNYLIKRIIGTPGDTVTIDDGKVYINGAKLEESYLKEEMAVEEEKFEITLPDDGYFVMGDNRNDSYDARYWENKVVYGDDITGIAMVKYWPFTEIELLR